MEGRGTEHRDREPLLAGTGRDGDVEEEQDQCGGLEGAVFNLSTTIVGAGIMALPAAVRVLGLPLGVMVMLSVGFLSGSAVEMVVRFCSKVNAESYEDVVGAICGRAWRIVTQVSVAVFTLGILVCYLIIIADVLAGSKEHAGLFEQWAGGEGWWCSRPLAIVLTVLLVLLPLAALPRLESLKYSSAVSIALALLFVVLAVAVTLVKLAWGETKAPRMLPDLSSAAAWYDLCAVVPIMSNAFICHFNVPPIYHEQRHKSRRSMVKVARLSLAFCTVLYVVTAVSCYLLFGEGTAADVLSNFDADLDVPYSRAVNYVIRVGYVVHVMLVFPVIFFSLRLTIDSALFPEARPLADSRSRKAALTLLLLGISVAGSTVFPDIWVAFNFTGATTGMVVGFILPAMLAIKGRSSSDPGDRFQRNLAWIMLPLAVFSGTISVVTEILSLI